MSDREQKITTKNLMAYGILGFPLGFIGMPLYVYLPKFYTENFGVSLMALSVLLLVTRIIDTIQDPLIGWYCDRLSKQKERSIRIPIIKICLPLLTVFFLALLFPQPVVHPVVWISIFLILTYTTYSFLSINYNTMAAEIAPSYNQQTKLVSQREGFALFGIAIGSIVPSALMNATDIEIAHFLTWGIFVVLLSGCVYFFLKNTPDIKTQHPASENIKEAFKVVIQNKLYVYLAGVFLLSTIAASLPATIVLFYIKDVLQGESLFGLFLGLYFLCALGGLPIWYKISEKIGKKKAWSLSMCGSIVGFIWATFLGPGDFTAFAIICVITGLCLGADLSMPFSMLADTVKSTNNKSKYYAVWGMLGKSSLALAGSLGLFALSILGYDPSASTTVQGATTDPEVISNQARWAVAISYAFIPCLIKLGSLIVLYKSPLDKQESTS